jgi:hypothetical protein
MIVKRLGQNVIRAGFKCNNTVARGLEPACRNNRDQVGVRVGLQKMAKRVHLFCIIADVQQNQIGQRRRNFGARFVQRCARSDTVLRFEKFDLQHNAVGGHTVYNENIAGHLVSF